MLQKPTRKAAGVGLISSKCSGAELWLHTYTPSTDKRKQQDPPGQFTLPWHWRLEKQMNWMPNFQMAEVKQVETRPRVKPSFNFGTELYVYTHTNICN